MKARLLFTQLIILLAIIALFPLGIRLSELNASPAQSNPDHMIKPMAELLQAGPQSALISVESLMDIEDCWAIEDTREYSDLPLVSLMRNGDAALGFDAASNTFYCTLGLDTSDSWPTLSLFAKSASNNDALKIAWVDDYSYDACSDAISEGYRYELLAYTPDAYQYFGIVFTGLPLVCVHLQQDAILSEAYLPAHISVSDAFHAAVNSAAQIHLRGGGSIKPIAKESYRIEFHDLSGGADQKSRLSLLGMEPDSDWLLLSNAQEPTAVRNALCFDMWRRWNAENNAPMKLENHMVEVFVQDQYMGLYQLSQRVDPQKELIRIGGNPLTDSVVRLVVGINAGKKPTLDIKSSANMWVEYRYDAQNQPLRAFSRFMDFAQLSLYEGHALERGGFLTDEAFSSLAETCIPVIPMMSYFLFSQVCGFTADNVFNNQYIWILNQQGTPSYLVSPWDMDMTLPTAQDASSTSMELSFHIPCRMLSLNTADCRKEAHRIWQEKRNTLLSSQAIYDWIIGMEEYINASGAYLRESERWYGAACPLSLSDILYYTESRLNTIDRTLLEEWPIHNAL